MRSVLGRPQEDFEDVTLIRLVEPAQRDATSEEQINQVVIPLPPPVSQLPKSIDTPNVGPAAPAEKTDPSSTPGHPKSGSSHEAKVEDDKVPPSGGNSNVKRTLIIGAVSGLTCMVAAPIVMPLVGFGGAGVAAGSLAAGWQASIGNVVAGSLFASLQSAGVVGLASSTVAAVGGVGTATGAGITAAVSALTNKKVSKEETSSASSPPSAPTSTVSSNDDHEKYGFGGAGVVAGNLASGGQATIGNMVAGSWFASLQSTGVVGLASSTVAAVGGVGTATAAGISAAVSALRGSTSAPLSMGFFWNITLGVLLDIFWKFFIF